MLDREDIVDMEVLGQILELDEPDNHEFSMGMAWAYFDQAKNTFEDMGTSLYGFIITSDLLITPLSTRRFDFEGTLKICLRYLLSVTS